VVPYFVAPAAYVFDRVEPVGPERLELEAKLLRISEGEAVTVRYPRSARFGVEPVRERLSKRVHPASRSRPGFESGHGVSRLSKLIRGRQTRKTRADYQHPLAAGLLSEEPANDGQPARRRDARGPNRERTYLEKVPPSCRRRAITAR